MIPQKILNVTKDMLNTKYFVMLYGIHTFYFQPFKMIAWAFNWILGQIAWTIIRFEIHHLWNPDWTYAFPQNFETVRDQQMPDPDGGQQLPEPIEEEEVFLTGEEMDTTTVILFGSILLFLLLAFVFATIMTVSITIKFTFFTG